MKNPFAKVPDALARLLIVFAAVIGLTIVVVKFVIPPRFKETSIQWADTVRRENARPVRFAGAVACADCHAEVIAEKRKGYHSSTRPTNRPSNLGFDVGTPGP